MQLTGCTLQDRITFYNEEGYQTVIRIEEDKVTQVSVYNGKLIPSISCAVVGNA